jgi:6-phosphogluconate dehydrogenase
MHIGYIGFGKMGLGQAIRMKEKGHEVIGFNRSVEGREKAREAGLLVKDSIKDMVDALPVPRTLWVMVSHQGVDEVVNELTPLLSKGDTIIDGGNCFYKDTIRRAKSLEEKGINFLDIGVSGGPHGARNGACLMIGGKKEVTEKYIHLYEDLSAPHAWKILGESGAGHFTKMVHNGIEYGMMQAIGEGFEVLRKSPFHLSLGEVAELYNHKSVIESRLVGWLFDAYKKHGLELDGISGEVSHSGEGQWTVDTAKEFNVPTPNIEQSLEFRKKSKGNPSYTGKVVSALRNQFGGHKVKE